MTLTKVEGLPADFYSLHLNEIHYQFLKCYLNAKGLHIAVECNLGGVKWQFVTRYARCSIC